MLGGVYFITYSNTSQKLLFSSLIISLSTAASDTPNPKLLVQPNSSVFLLLLFLPISSSGVGLMITASGQSKTTLTHELVNLTLQTQILGLMYVHLYLEGLSIQGTFAIWLFPRPSLTVLMPALQPALDPGRIEVRKRDPRRPNWKETKSRAKILQQSHKTKGAGTRWKIQMQGSWTENGKSHENRKF